jgi:hypothetical protein
MQELLNQVKIDESRIKRLVVNIVSSNLSSLAIPCFYPELKKHLYEFLRISNITEKDIKEYTKRRWKGRKESKFRAQSDPIANFYVFLIQYFLRKKDKNAYKHFMIFYLIRHYANLMRKYFKYCNDETFKYALEILTRTHLFAREKTIPNALFFMSDEMIRRYTRALEKDDLDGISKFMQESRNRVEQSLRSFASTYYRTAESGAGLKTEEIPEDSDNEDAYKSVSIETGTRLIDDIVRKITVYRYIDHKGLEESRRLAKVNASLATQIVGKLNDTKHVDNLRIIFKLFVKELKDAKSLCGKDYYPLVRKLMSVKRTRSQIYFKQQVGLLLVDVLKKIGYEKKYNDLTSQTQFLINLFLAYYVTMVLRNSVC